MHVNNNRWLIDHDERLTCHYLRVEEVEMVLPVVVALKMMTCGSWGRLWKLAGHVAPAVASATTVLPELEKEVWAVAGVPGAEEGDQVVVGGRIIPTTEEAGLLDVLVFRERKESSGRKKKRADC